MPTRNCEASRSRGRRASSARSRAPASLTFPSSSRSEAGYAAKYQGRPTLRYDGRHAWLTVDIDKIVSWDFSKIAEEGTRADQG